MATPAQREILDEGGPESTGAHSRPGITDYSELWLPGSPLPVRIEYAAIRELKRANFEASDGQTGVLLGLVSRQAILIQRFELVEASAERSDSLGPLLQARIRESQDSSPSVVGFFRTEVSGWRGITASDREFAKQYLPVSNAVFLLIQTPAHRPWTAAISALDAAGAPAVEIPFDEYFLRNGYVGPAVERAPAPPAAPRKRDFREIAVTFSIALLIALLVAAAVLVFIWPRSPEPSDLADTAPATASMLSFKVNRIGGDFEVSWDRASSAVLRATSGTFTVHDGGFTKTVHLTPEQLREARIVYTPLLGDLDFRLEIATNDHRTQAESVQVLGWSAPPVAPPVTAQPPPSSAASIPVRPALPASPTGAQTSKTAASGVTAPTALPGKSPGVAPPVKPLQNSAPSPIGVAPAAQKSTTPVQSGKSKTQAPSASK